MNLLAIVVIGVAAMPQSGQRPEWAEPTVPDTVVALVMAATDAPAGDERKERLREAEAAARASVVGHEGDIARRYALAIVLGLRANAEGGQTKVKAASDLSRELDAVLVADSSHAGARHMLGRLHAGVRRMNRITRWIATNLLGGDELKRATWEAAEVNLAYAEVHATGVADHHLQLALLYRDTGRAALAIDELEHVLGFEAKSALDAEVLAEAAEVLADLASQ
ncbi:MAG: hypothetical protein FJ207_11010 [Gemmatimonadetes bacterium]|nr:hypothetical protein [Gemmatimonadota bacterium]